MNNEKDVRNFYNEEAEYEKSILITKELINNIIKYDEIKIQDKLKFLQKENDFEEYVDLLTAIIGKNTNKYYYCENVEDVKYYQLEVGKVYKMTELNADIQSKNSIKKQLNLQARALLAEKLLVMTVKLKQLFLDNIQKGDGSLSTIDSFIITKLDVEYLEYIIEYLNMIIDKTGRLKILVAEKDIYAYENAKLEYSKKTLVEKWFYKVFNKENMVIENMAKRNKEKK